MTNAQKIQLRLSEVRSRLNAVSGLEGDAFTAEIQAEAEALQTEYQTLEVRHRAAVVGEVEEAGKREAKFNANNGEGREIRSLSRKVRLGEYLHAAAENRSVGGAEHEFNSALRLKRPNGFPLRLISPAAREERATTDVSTKADAAGWLDRLFAMASARHLGVTFESVSPGETTYPVVTAGATGEQQDRGEDTTDAAWTVSSTRLTPKRNSVRAVFNMEDDYRLPSLESALRRDLGMAVMDAVDKAVFLGDSGPSTAAYDIVGLNTAASVVQVDVTQANKLLFPGTMDSFNSFVDGIHASSNEDLKIVAAVGAHRLWCRTIFLPSADGTNMKTALGRNGISWMVRGDIETDTTNGDWGAFIGRARGLQGSGVAAIWDEGLLIRDPYSNADTGEVALTLSYFWDLGFPRPSNFGRLRFVT